MHAITHGQNRDYINADTQFSGDDANIIVLGTPKAESIELKTFGVSELLIPNLTAGNYAEVIQADPDFNGHNTLVFNGCNYAYGDLLYSRIYGAELFVVMDIQSVILNHTGMIVGYPTLGHVDTYQLYNTFAGTVEGFSIPSAKNSNFAASFYNGVGGTPPSTHMGAGSSFIPLATGPAVVRVRVSPSNIEWKIQNGPIGNKWIDLSHSNQPLFIAGAVGGRKSGSSIADYLQGVKIAEIIGYVDLLPIAESDQVYEALRVKYAIE